MRVRTKNQVGCSVGAADEIQPEQPCELQHRWEISLGSQQMDTTGSLPILETTT